jgi:hypothetical protein
MCAPRRVFSCPVDSSYLFYYVPPARLLRKEMSGKTLAEDTKTREEHIMITQILMILLCLGVLSTVNGCYEEPSPYETRPSYQGAGQPTYRESMTTQEREYWRQRRAQERAYREQERDTRPDWLR